MSEHTHGYSHSNERKAPFLLLQCDLPTINTTMQYSVFVYKCTLTNECHTHIYNTQMYIYLHVFTYIWIYVFDDLK
jgi:hypothetical protein